MTRAGLRVDYETRPALDLAGARGTTDVLGIARLAAGCGSPLATLEDIPLVHVAARTIEADPEIYEVWRSTSPISRGRLRSLHYGADGQILFGALNIAHDGGSLSAATEAAYSEIFQNLEELGYPHLLRTWNYFPGINLEADGVERYRQFNAARQRAFRAHQREIRVHVPAACALGTHGGDALVIYFLAGVDAALSIENPRQVPGYDYPREYGEASPTFARAAMTTPGSTLAAGFASTPEPILFVSGTASIRGSRSMFPGDVRAQTRETVANLRALLEAANRAAGDAQFDAETLSYKVYLRRPEDVAAVAGEIAAGLDPRTRLLYLQADICRAELLVEIEALGFGSNPRAR